VTRHVASRRALANRISRKGTVAIVAVISPYRAVRAEARRAHAGSFIEVFVDCPLEVLVRRDPKGLYARALRGEIQDFTGVSRRMSRRSIPRSIFERTVNRSMHPLSGSSRLSRVGA
jgi:adenylylsulfate kinase-like enzyme